MSELIACLSTGKGTWIHVSKLIEEGKWDKVFLITNEFGKENFTNKKNAEFILIDTKKSLKELREEIKEKLKDKIKGTEVAVNLISGIGKEHMALISALLQLGLGVRFIALTEDGLEEI